MARRPGLGRGLDALIPSDDDNLIGETIHSTQNIIQVPIDRIHPNPQQPRKGKDDDALNELADSIREHGIIQPLIASNDADHTGYSLIAGERRWLAAKIAGLSSVPVIVRTVSEQEQLELALIENLQREDLNPLEMAEAYQQLSENFSLTHEQIAERVGKSRASVTNTIRLLNLPDQAQKALIQGFISEGHARALLSLPNANAQRAALSTVLNLSLNVRQTEALVKKLSGEKPYKAPKPQQPPEILAIEERLRQRFGTKVNLKHGKQGGSVIIYYYSDEELNDILDKIVP